MAMSVLVNKQWDKTIDGVVVFFFITQLSQALSDEHGDTAYAFGWKDMGDNSRHIEYSNTAPTFGDVEATY